VVRLDKLIAFICSEIQQQILSASACPALPNSAPAVCSIATQNVSVDSERKIRRGKHKNTGVSSRGRMSRSE
jgi:hypothetical protein